MDKKMIIKMLTKSIQDELDKAYKAQESFNQYKFETDMKAESKYDTRSIEAAYLAEGHEKRIEELKLEMKLIEEIPTRGYSDDQEIAIGALLEIKYEGKVRHYFLSTTAGGTMLSVEGKTVLVISVFSPIGSAVLGLKKGDHFEVETNSGVREYQIIAVS